MLNHRAETFALDDVIAAPGRGRAVQFARDEEGGMLVWSTFMIIGILMAVGLGIDMLRTENFRTHMQNTLDRAVLAAADLEQDLTPEEVVRDYFERSGLPGEAVHIDSTSSETERVVSADISGQLGTMLIDLVGKHSLPAKATGEAREAITDVEISLVLDNSGSMGWNDNLRLNLLKPAAQNFIDMVMQPGPFDEPSTVSVSLVPFATQVNAGPLLGGALNYTSEHTYSFCAEFEGDSFDTVAMDPDDELRRGGHFDIFTWDAPVKTEGVVCPFDTSRHIAPFSQDADYLKGQIEAMWAGGNTSIDIATKWGAALLDPAFRPVVDELIGNADLPSEVSGRPFDYGRPDTMKVLVVMSDGQNTQEFQLRDDYRSGNSMVWQDPGTGIVSYFDEDSGQYFVFESADITTQPSGSWQAEPFGNDAAINLKWPEVWNNWSVRVFARDIKAEAIGGNWKTYRDAVYDTTVASNKNTRTEEICEAARNQEIIVYTVGMDIYGQGEDTLLACAGTTINFFAVAPEDVDVAFSAIARQINLLRLTQ
ncbi:MAG: Tad domain-containing protein [Pseudomonadota bacterium]